MSAAAPAASAAVVPVVPETSVSAPAPAPAATTGGLTKSEEAELKALTEGGAGGEDGGEEGDEGEDGGGEGGAPSAARLARLARKAQAARVARLRHKQFVNDRQNEANALEREELALVAEEAARGPATLAEVTAELRRTLKPEELQQLASWLCETSGGAAYVETYLQQQKRGGPDGGAAADAAALPVRTFPPLPSMPDTPHAPAPTPTPAKSGSGGS
eukprot:scaffold17586_cov112-Isochrysis_galbana.AAC.1